VSGRDKAGTETRQPGRQGECCQQTHLCKCCIYTVYPKKFPIKSSIASWS